jgi:hypothetical protein
MACDCLPHIALKEVAWEECLTRASGENCTVLLTGLLHSDPMPLAQGWLSVPEEKPVQQTASSWGPLGGLQDPAFLQLPRQILQVQLTLLVLSLGPTGGHLG